MESKKNEQYSFGKNEKFEEVNSLIQEKGYILDLNKLKEKIMSNKQKLEIFHKLKDPRQYQKAKSCHICKVKFKFLMSNRFHCHFCGQSVCVKHSENSRQNPQNEKEYHKICDDCHQSYILQQIADDFLKLQYKIQKNLDHLEEKKSANLNNLNQQLQEYSQKKLEFSKLKKNFLKQQQNYENQIVETKSKLEKLESDQSNIGKSTMKISQQLNAIQQQDEVVGIKLSQNSIQLKQLKDQIQFLQNNIQLLQQAMEETELNISKNQILKSIYGNDTGTDIDKSLYQEIKMESVMIDSFISVDYQYDSHKNKIKNHLNSFNNSSQEHLHQNIKFKKIQSDKICAFCSMF